MGRFTAALLLVAPAGALSLADSGAARPDAAVMPDLSGRWEGRGWGAVTLRRAPGGGYEGTYTDTYGKGVGRLRLWFSPRSGAFEGTWGEGRYRYGRLSVRVAGGAGAAGPYSGSYSADAACEYDPGSPAAEAFRWARVAE
jgi:hypothetical protein